MIIVVILSAISVILLTMATITSIGLYLTGFDAGKNTDTGSFMKIIIPLFIFGICFGALAINIAAWLPK